MMVVLLIPAAIAAQETKLPQQFVGNYFGYFNPTAGGGTQMWTIDIDENGHYLAFCSSADYDAVRGTLAVIGDKWTLTHEKETLDKGTIETMGPAITLRGGKGAMMLNKVSPESKQRFLNEMSIDPKRAALQPLLERGLVLAREWRKDAILVNVRCQPDIDGEIDLTVQGGNLMLFFYCPSRDSGALAMVSAFAEISLTPQKEPVSPWKLAIPTNCIGVKEAMSHLKKLGIKRVSDAELYGMGQDADLRTFCWVLRHDNGLVAVDAVLPQVHDYREFMDGRPRAGKGLPFAHNSGIVSRVSIFGSDGYYMYFYRSHAVYLDGVDEAILVRVPWRYIDESEWRPYTTEKDGAMLIGDLTGKLSAGKYTPLTPAQRALIEKDSSSLKLDCPPGLVLLENCPKGLIPRVKAQLESYWKRTYGRQ
jgi:hypothetical protein